MKSKKEEPKMVVEKTQEESKQQLNVIEYVNSLLNPDFPEDEMSELEKTIVPNLREVVMNREKTQEAARKLQSDLNTHTNNLVEMKGAIDTLIAVLVKNKQV